jgi:hypothetical protein
MYHTISGSEWLWDVWAGARGGGGLIPDPGLETPSLVVEMCGANSRASPVGELIFSNACQGRQHVLC